jgi:hypothetical protein
MIDRHGQLPESDTRELIAEETGSRIATRELGLVPCLIGFGHDSGYVAPPV